jgi:hypothetical protein
MLYPIQIYFLCVNAIVLISDPISNDIQKFFLLIKISPILVNHRVLCIFI